MIKRKFNEELFRFIENSTCSFTCIDTIRNELINKDSRFGHIVCRCEAISEGEVIDAIHRNAGAKTIKGVKKRCRPGFGKCQGGFCEPLILQILARELNKDPMSIRYDSNDSYILDSETKGGSN